mmetsp:Transcript_10362/g.12998  ORF Transcript_10362/g.12998 Transcript_10362/m.12998 type:complete len:189 (+) Transcript_10362:2-568(+)
MSVVAGSLMKIANDLCFLGSGPNCGLGELTLPANEPGSSFMPGKVNPSQCEAVAMVCAQVMGNHVATNVGGAHGHCELNTFKPVMILNLLSSARLIGDSCRSFARHCVSGIQVNQEHISELLHKSQIEALALNPKLGYENTMRVCQKASKGDTSLMEAAIDLGLISKDDNLIGKEECCPENMINPQKK